MAECGSWRSFTELEEWLTLEELLELYDMAGERQFRLIRAIAAAMGAEIPDYHSDDDNLTLGSAHDVAQLPFGLGYEQHG